MATGANIQPGRGREVSNLPPQVDMRTGEAEVYESARRVFDSLADAKKPDLIRRAQARGAAEGLAVAAGEAMPERNFLFGGDVAEARTAALGTAYLARTKSDIDDREDALRREHRYQPEAYQAASAEVASTYIQNAPPEFAVEVEAYVRDRTSAGFSAIANARQLRDDQETTQSLSVRAARLDERLLALVKEGKEDSFEFLQTRAERGALQMERTNNPVVLYSEDQRDADEQKLAVGMASAQALRGAVQEYEANGGGSRGNAAASRYLDERVLRGTEDYPPEVTQEIYREARQQLAQFTLADRDERRYEDEQARERRAQAATRVGEYQFRIAQGDYSTADIEEDPLLDDGQRARLVNAASGGVRREAVQARRDEALEAQESRETYSNYRDEALTGGLTPAELAEAVEAGHVSRGQARTLQGLSDKSLKPAMDDVLAPFRDSIRGRNRRDAAQVTALAEQAALELVRSRPDMNLEQRMVAGAVIAERALGRSAQGRPETGATAQANSLSRIRAVNADIAAKARTGTPYTGDVANRMRAEARNGD